MRQIRRGSCRGTEKEKYIVKVYGPWAWHDETKAIEIMIRQKDRRHWKMVDYIFMELEPERPFQRQSP